jgi:hypothetical protein
MLDPRPRTHRFRRFMPAVLVALSAAVAVCAPLAAAKTVEFHSTAPVRGIDLGLPQPKLGITGKVEFHTSAADKRALSAAKKSEELLTEATARTDAAAKADRRIAAIEQLLNEAQDDQTRLEAIISTRLAEQYKAVLEELRDINGDQARSLQDRAARLDQVLVAAKVGHDEAPEELTGKNAPKGVKGTWYVMDGAFTAQLFMPGGGSGYDGGTRTPARQATGLQIQTVLSDKRIDLDASGYQDVLTGQIDGRILDAMVLAAQQFGYIKISSLKSDHGVYTAGGNVSEHSYGCAMDIGTIGSTYITPGAQTPGGEVNQAVLFFSGLGVATGKPDLAPHQVISLFDLGGATLAMGDHGDHIHVGYSC